MALTGTYIYWTKSYFSVLRKCITCNIQGKQSRRALLLIYHQKENYDIFTWFWDVSDVCLPIFMIALNNIFFIDFYFLIPWFFKEHFFLIFHGSNFQCHKFVHFSRKWILDIMFQTFALERQDPFSSWLLLAVCGTHSHSGKENGDNFYMELHAPEVCLRKAFTSYLSEQHLSRR